MAGKKTGKDKGKGKGKAKKKNPDDSPSVNEIILKRVLTLYEGFVTETETRCCPDVIASIKLCLEEEKELKKVNNFSFIKNDRRYNLDIQL
jgi:hypothetical protein